MKYLILVLFLVSTSANAGGWSNPAIPTRIDLERGNGFMVYGAFGNAGECTVANRIYVQASHPQYEKIYSTVLAAFMAGKKVQSYIHTCAPVGWYSVMTTTYNTLTPEGALNLTN